MMDETDVCSPETRLDKAGCIFPQEGETKEYRREECEESLFEGTGQKGDNLASPYFEECSPHRMRRPFGTNDANASLTLWVGGEHCVGSSSQRIPMDKSRGLSYDTIASQCRQPVEKNPCSTDQVFHDGRRRNETVNLQSSCNAGGDSMGPFDFYPHHHGGTDETDQGRVVPATNLGHQIHSEHPAQFPSTQYYAKPGDGLPVGSPSGRVNANSDVTVTTSSGLPQTAMSQVCARSDKTLPLSSSSSSSSSSSCAINHAGSVQGQPKHNSKRSLESDELNESAESTKRKNLSKERECGEDERMASVDMKPKVAPVIQSDVQYNQSILSVPTQQNVSGKNNLVINQPSNCTFNVYKGQQGALQLSQTQHASQWAVTVETDGTNDSTPMRALAAVASQTVSSGSWNWKMFARYLYNTDVYPNLEADMSRLDRCAGTTEDKTTAVLTKWWRGHPQRGDVTAMREQLGKGLKSCNLNRLASKLDSYL